jgi:hypothetical protein
LPSGPLSHVGGLDLARPRGAGPVAGHRHRAKSPRRPAGRPRATLRRPAGAFLRLPLDRAPVATQVARGQWASAAPTLAPHALLLVDCCVERAPHPSGRSDVRISARATVERPRRPVDRAIFFGDAVGLSSAKHVQSRPVCRSVILAWPLHPIARMVPAAVPFRPLLDRESVAGHDGSG